MTWAPTCRLTVAMGFRDRQVPPSINCSHPRATPCKSSWEMGMPSRLTVSGRASPCLSQAMRADNSQLLAAEGALDLFQGIEVFFQPGDVLLHLDNGRPEFGHRAERVLADPWQLRIGTALT